MAKKVVQLKKIKIKKNIKFAIILIIILGYMLWTIFQFYNAKKITSYEVRQGSIVMDTAFTGFAIRNETVVSSKSSGYINFLISDTDKVGVNSDVYTISSSKLKYTESSEDDEKDADSASGLTTDEQNSLAIKIQDFDKNFYPSDFSNFYTLRDYIDETIASKSNQTKKSQLMKMAEDNNDIEIVKSGADGFLVYELDGFEDVNEDNFDVADLEKGTSSSKVIEDNTKVQKGDSIYKIVSDNYWTLVIKLSDDMASNLQDKEAVKVKFAKDAQTETASFSISKINNAYYGFLKFSKSMIRYAGDRFVDIELMLEDQSGLKIPKTSIVKKAFYTVPEEYITQGGDSKSDGVMVDDGSDTSQFTATEIYYKDEATGMVYLDTNSFKEGTYIIKPGSDEKYCLYKKKKLKGVYNINKGYAVFKQVQILAESDEYYIVQTGNSYGLANYDHIALDGSLLKENDVIN